MSVEAFVGRDVFVAGAGVSLGRGATACALQPATRKARARMPTRRERFTSIFTTRRRSRFRASAPRASRETPPALYIHRFGDARTREVGQAPDVPVSLAGIERAGAPVRARDEQKHVTASLGARAPFNGTEQLGADAV